MNLDIVSVQQGMDLGLAVTDVSKAGNIVSTQLGILEYSPFFGVDLDMFLESELRFPDDSFKSYLVQRLSEQGVTVAQVIDTVTTFVEKITFSVGDSGTENDGGLIL